MIKKRRESSAGHFSRRSFLSSLGAAGVVATSGPFVAAAQAAPAAPAVEAPGDTIEGAVSGSGKSEGTFGDPKRKFSTHSFGAQFAEVTWQTRDCSSPRLARGHGDRCRPHPQPQACAQPD